MLDVSVQELRLLLVGLLGKLAAEPTAVATGLRRDGSGAARCRTPSAAGDGSAATSAADTEIDNDRDEMAALLAPMRVEPPVRPPQPLQKPHPGPAPAPASAPQPPAAASAEHIPARSPRTSGGGNGGASDSSPTAAEGNEPGVATGSESGSEPGNESAAAAGGSPTVTAGGGGSGDQFWLCQSCGKAVELGAECEICSVANFGHPRRTTSAALELEQAAPLLAASIKTRDLSLGE